MGKCETNTNELECFRPQKQSDKIKSISWMDQDEKDALLLLTKLGFFIDFEGPLKIPANKNQKVIYEFRAWRSDLPLLNQGPQ